MTAWSKRKAAIAAEESLEHKAPDRTSSKSSSEESYEVLNSRRGCHHTCSCNCWNRGNKSVELNSTGSMSYMDSGRNIWLNYRKERLSFSEPDSHHWSQRARYETYKKNTASKVICPVNDRYREALDFRPYLLANTSGRYDDKIARNVAKWAKRLRLQMKTNTFDSFHPSPS